MKHLDVNCSRDLDAFFKLQLEAYQSEAALIGSKELPPLKESKESIRSSKEKFIGIWQYGELVAAISFTIAPEKIEICKLVVGTQYQRKGYGKRLVQFVLSEYAASKECLVSTASKNIPACRLYLDLNFQELDIQATPEGIDITNFSHVPKS